VVIADAGSDLPGFGDWAEQLIAESTGKQGKGLLPVVVPDTSAPNFTPNSADCILLTLGDTCLEPPPASHFGASVRAPLGAAMLLWEYAVPVAGRIIGINPFDQPDVESAKQAARDMLEGGAGTPEPEFSDGDVDVFATPGLLAGGKTVEDAVDSLLSQLDPQQGYLAVMAYLDRAADSGLALVREALAARTGRPVTFGWGPRFLHSTGQYHKGGPPTGVFLQITAEPTEDLEIPGRPFTFGSFIQAQAIGDGTVLAEHHRPVLRLHLRDHDAGLQKVQEVLGR
jgi:glucose-6-phosphate isomerase